MKHPCLVLLCLMLPCLAFGEDPKGPPKEEPLAFPEPLVPGDVPCFVRGVGLEALQSHLDAFCNKFPGALAARLRLKAGPFLSRPYLVAADGTRPWGIVVMDPDKGRRAEETAFLLPVEDADAFRQAATAGLEGVQVRVLRGYALVSRNPALLDRLGRPESPLAPPSLKDDVVARFSIPGLKSLAHGTSARARALDALAACALVPERLPGLIRRLMEQAASVEVGGSLGEAGLKASVRVHPRPGSRLAALCAGQPSQPARWIGLAPAGAAFASECHLDAAAAGAALRVFEPGLESLCAGDGFLSVFRNEEGWQCQAVSRLADKDGAREALRKDLGLSTTLIGEPITACSYLINDTAAGITVGSDYRTKEMDQLHLHTLLLKAKAAANAVPPWGALCGGDGRALGLAAAVSKGLLVLAAGREAEERVAHNAAPLGEGLEPRLAPSSAALLEDLPKRASAFALVSLGQAMSLASRAWPALAPRGELPEMPLAAALRCEDGDAELTLVVPGRTLMDLPRLMKAMKGAQP